LPYAIVYPTGPEVAATNGAAVHEEIAQKSIVVVEFHQYNSPPLVARPSATLVVNVVGDMQLLPGLQVLIE
jgi:hypothetical protein